FSHVTGDDRDICTGLIRYIVDGADSKSLLEAGGRRSIGTSLRLHHSFLSNNDQAWKLTQKLIAERKQFFWPKTAVPAEVWMRLGQAFEAILIAGNVKPTVLTEWPGWLKTLMGVALISTESQTERDYWSIDRWEEMLGLGGVSKDFAARLILDPQQTNVL